MCEPPWSFKKGETIYRVVSKGGPFELEMQEHKMCRSFSWELPGHRLLVCDPPLGGHKPTKDRRCRVNGEYLVKGKQAVNPEATPELLASIGRTPGEAIKIFTAKQLEKVLDLTRQKERILRSLLDLRHSFEEALCQQKSS